MLHRASIVAALVGVNVFCLGVGIGTVVGQDAQAEATAKATKRQAADDVARSTLDVAKPTDVGVPPRTGTTAPPESEKLNRRAGEQRGDSARGRTLILGMHVKEAADGSVEVVDVGAATPAQEAGIRKGDKIIVFQNFKADSYRKWIDGMRRLATEATDGSMVTVVVSRDGSPVTTKVRIPENQVGPIKLPLGPQPQNPQAGGNEVNTVVANGGDSNVSIGNSGAIASFFTDASQPGAERAVAELFRIGPSHKVSESGLDNGNVENNQRPSARPPQPGGARVGFAGFRNDADGMLVMVDVGGLEPGNYTVSIADANVIGNQTQSIQSPASNNPTRRPAFGTRTLQGPADESNPNGFVQNSPGAPVEAPGAVSPPQSNLEPPSGEAPRTTLAQGTGNAASDATPPATGQVQSLTASATGQVNPTNTAPTGRSNVPGAQGGSSNENRNAAAPPMQNSVGTLTVDQSGTGRMQQVVEGVRVRNVLGQALVIYAATNSPTSLPPNLDVTVDPASPKTTPKSESSNSPNSPAASSANRAEPVVGGVIHLLSDRGGPAIGQKSN